METFEQKYNEALNWIRNIYPTLKDSDKEDAEHYFPELKESEDERTNRELINYVNRYVSDSDPRKKHWLAYLEKQKEQKHYWKPTETDVALFNKAVTTNKALTPTERAQLDIIRSKFGCCRASTCNGIVQQEQKPAEWSEDKYPKDIEKDATQFCFDKGINITPHQAKEIATHLTYQKIKNVARHFYELGLRRAAEMYDEIEYNRQRVEEE